MRQFVVALCVVVAISGSAFAQEVAQTTQMPLPPKPAAPALTLAEQERFLVEAEIVKVKGAPKGVTSTQRATLTDGTITHDASIQTVDETVARFETSRGPELNFRDYWGYNVAAYRLGVMLGLDNIPTSVFRRFRAKEAAFTWWIDDVMMDEQARTEKKVEPPAPRSWLAQNDITRVFDELIANIDRNQGNVLIDKRWKVWLIDHSRAFRTKATLRNPQAIRRCERSLFEKLKALTAASVKEQLDDYLTEYEMAAVLKRRDLIVARIEELGPGALYDLTRP